MKKLILTVFTICFIRVSKGQVALGYFPFNYSKVQLTTNPDKLIFADFRVETNSFISNLNLELAVHVNLTRSDKYNFYIGPGFSGNPVYSENENLINGYFTSAGLRWMPISKLRQLGIIFELSPYLDNSFESGRLRSQLGLSYHFGKE